MAAPSTFTALAVRGLWEPSSCPEGTLKELQCLNSKFKGGNERGVSGVWEKEQSQGRRGKIVAQGQVGRKEQRGKEDRQHSLSEEKRGYQQRDGGLPSPITTRKFTKTWLPSESQKCLGHEQQVDRHGASEQLVSRFWRTLRWQRCAC